MKVYSLPDTTYTKADLVIIISMMQDAIDELEDWSEHNNEEHSNHIQMLQTVLNDIEFEAKK